MSSNRGLRILYMGTLPPHRGGSAISCGQLIAGIARAGYSIFAIAPATPETLVCGDRFAEAHPELQIARYLLPQFNYEPGPPELTAMEHSQVGKLFRDSLRRFQPDLIIVGRESFAPYLPAPRVLDGPAIIQWSRGSANSHYSYWKNTADGRLRVRQFRRARVILTTADHLTEDLKRLGLCRVRTIPNAIDLQSFLPRPGNMELREKLGIRREQSVVLAPANLVPRKRPFDVLEAAAKVLRRNSSLIFVMVGTGKLQGEAERVCERLGLRDHFRFTGWVEYEDMPDYYNLADVVVVPSELEGMARAYIEAMACERLLLASDISAAREVIHDGINGILFPVADTERLASRILTAVEEPVLRERLGKEARRSIQDRSVDDAVRRYVEEIEAVFDPPKVIRC